jgi:hypothetical protein
MKRYRNYVMLLALVFVIVGIALYYNAATEEGFGLPLPQVSLPQVRLPGVSLPGIILPGVRLPSARPYMRRARLFGENSVRQLEKMTTESNARAMMDSN